MAIIVRNPIIPPKAFKAVTLWPWIFVRSDARFSERDERHERIHLHQQEEMLRVGVVVCAISIILGGGLWSALALPMFYWWYGIEWLIRLFTYGFDAHRAYRMVAFEQEAYFFEGDYGYLDRRGDFKWTDFLKY